MLVAVSGAEGKLCLRGRTVSLGEPTFSCLCNIFLIQEKKEEQKARAP